MGGWDGVPRLVRMLVVCWCTRRKIFMILGKTPSCKNCGDPVDRPWFGKPAEFCAERCRNAYKTRMKRRRRKERLVQSGEWEAYRSKERIRLHPYHASNAAMRLALPRTLTQTDWQRALDYFENRCAYCGSKPERLHREHFIPATMGGGLTPDNIVPACPNCNAKKHAKHPAEWLAGKPEVYERVMRYLNGIT